MDGESIRNGLRDVFGDFNDLCKQISNTSGALSHRHGVVTPATPVGPRPNPFAPSTNNNSRPRTPPSTQSARICLQTMTELVEDIPLQPPAPTSFNRDLNQEPSTSSKGTAEEPAMRRKKRKNRTNDSDSDMEREGRKRHADHSSKPSTSKGLPPPVYKDLFGDDTSKPNEAAEKAVSPDSGVHSNEGIDETDISQMIHVMSNLMPMLSPITSRPQDKDRQRREKSERRARKELEKRRKEEEKREQEDKDRRRREERELEKKAAEERERREAEEKERKEAEERLRREQEEEKRKEEEKTRKEAEERQRREEEKQRREEEKLRKLKREEEKQRKEAERRRKEAEEVEKTRVEKEREERRRIQEEMDRQSPEAKFSGTLTLRNLSTERLSQLLDIGRKSTKLEKLEGSRNSSRSPIASPYATKVEKEDRLVASEGKLESRLEAKLDPRNVPSPRSGSTKRDFHCAGNECIPQKPILPTKIKDGDGTSPGEVYQEMAKAKKRQADIQDDKVKRILLYLECMVYFTMAAQYYITHERNNYSHLSIIRDTATLISGVTNRFLYHDTLNPLDQHYASRVRVLSIRAQSILHFHAFNIKMANTIKTAQIIDKSEAQCQFHNPDGPVPSPSDSLNSGSNSAANMTVTMPLEVYTCYKTQLRHLHGLMNAHKLWADSASYISKSPADTLFINSLESLCGGVTIMSPIDKMAIFILTAVSWLRDEQELELKRPQPPALKEAKSR